MKDLLVSPLRQHEANIIRQKCSRSRTPAVASTAPVLLAAGIGVGICSSVIPYVCDQLAMARLPRPASALLLALLPATATVIGLVVLAQVPRPAEAAGVALVVAGVAVHRDRS